jgi:hypothetical protein
VSSEKPEDRDAATPPNMTIFEFHVFVGMIYSRNYQKLNLKNDRPFFPGQV